MALRRAAEGKPLGRLSSAQESKAAMQVLPTAGSSRRRVMAVRISVPEVGRPGFGAKPPGR